MQKETKALRERKLCQAAAAVSPSGQVKSSQVIL